MNAPLMLENTYTADELYDLDKEHRFELADGALVERHMSAESGLIIARLVARLGAFAESRGLGFAFTSETGYKMFPDEPRSLRFPDASFVRRGRFPDDRPPRRGHAALAPDLAVEVVSPNDEAEEVEARVSDFLRAGVALVWVVYPGSRSAYALRPAGAAARLTESGELSGEDVLPGFTCPLRDLFQGL